MAKRNNDSLTIGEALREFVSENKLQKGLDKVDIKEAWKSEMGVPIAKYTSTVKLEGSTLHIRLNSSVLREELSYGKEKIIKLLNEKLGKELVKKLVLR